MSCSFDPKQIRVALLAGGKSGERSISLASGEGAKEALLEAGFPVTVFDPANKEDLLALIQGDFDVAFLALHGKYGEDGTIQGFLETIGLPYIGPGIWSSATAIDKPKTKLCYERAGIPTPRSMMLDSHHIDIDAIIAEVGSHCVVKAATEGSALGVYLCEGAEEIADAIDKVFQVDTCAFVESFVSGEEFTVSRSDLIKDAEGNFWVLETNTIPGMTATSLLPDAARAAGMSFAELCTKLISYALEN